jgi:ubiquinone/menaquinone biosynthesis C-methylase UbiE
MNSQSNKENIRCDQKRIADKNYVSSNPFIQFVLSRLLKSIAVLLKKINATSLLTLDIGCGEGHMIKYLNHQQLVRRYIGADLDKDKIGFAALRHPFCPYLAVDVGALAFKDNTFDCIVATEILEHLPEPLSALREIKRVAKPGAHFIISVPNEPFFSLGNVLRGKYWERGGKTPDHVSFWRPSEFRRMLLQQCEIEKEYIFFTFPWMLFRCRF